MSVTHLPARGLGGCIPLDDVTSETVDISKYLDIGFYNRAWLVGVSHCTAINQRLKRNDRGYEGLRPDPCDWLDMMEEDLDFAKEFRIVFNNQGIPDADEFTPKVLEDAYINGANIEESGIYLGATLSKMTSIDDIECWAFSSGILGKKLIPSDFSVLKD
eukprot:3357691-Ditylum_brightwellii.AAC.1